MNGFDELSKRLFVRLPETIKKMAFNADANVAALARLKEQASKANQLHMGRSQIKSHGKQRVERVFSKWDSKVGWVSTTKQAANGETGFRMSNFSWERPRKTSVTAEYTNQLAFLWGKGSKPYEQWSPLVGHDEKHLGRWAPGQKRPVRYNWSTVYSIVQGTVSSALSRTEKQFEEELRKL